MRETLRVYLCIGIYNISSPHYNGAVLVRDERSLEVNKSSMARLREVNP